MSILSDPAPLLVAVPAASAVVAKARIAGQADMPALLAALGVLSSPVHLLEILEQLDTLLPDLLEPWKVVGHDGQLGAAAELHIHARARYGRGAELRLRIMTLVAERLAAAGVGLAS